MTRNFNNFGQQYSRKQNKVWRVAPRLGGMAKNRGIKNTRKAKRS